MTPEQAREKYGIGWHDVKRAQAVAEERFNGNLELGVLFIDAAALAVSVKGGPEARNAWNEARARSRYKEILA